ncbi:MAG: GNAT family N-acetyltransferase [Verrucomicrobia bacterium]|nr:GNAT family N-acetyltransferase [Verrucomicrobiota bacterium]MBI3870230.1 GNAT family N-acetyltransferase [Verrucomicrobiota bacterium]
MKDIATAGIASAAERAASDPSPSGCYRPLELGGIDPDQGTLLFTDRSQDPFWDGLLSASRFGQFQQSSGWGAAKSAEGWKLSRFLYQRNEAIAVGFQILWKNSRFGKIGFASKGPVVFGQEKAEWPTAARQLTRAVRWLGLRALLVQPPDHGLAAEEALQAVGFQREKAQEVIDATLWFDLSGNEADILARMPGYNRTFIRQAERRGVRVREGGAADLELFYDLMIRTCVRQQTKPNPSSLAALKQVWKGFEADRSMRLTFAEADGEVIAALTSIRFGDRLTLWKKGWKDGTSKLRPNHLLYHESLIWAQRMGCAFCDFYSVRRDIAETLIAGGKPNEEQSASRDRFHLGFGGAPQLLPQSQIYFPNPVIRRVYALGAILLNAVRKRRSRRRRTAQGDAG